MERLQKKPRTLLTLVLSLIVLYEIMPLFNGYIGAYGELGLILVGFVLLLPISKKNFYSILATMAIFALFIFINTYTRNDGFLLNIYKILKCCFIAIIPIYLLLENEKEILKKLFWIAIIAVTITQITTIIALIVDPMISRQLITLSSYSESEVADLSKQNVGGYLIAYMLPVISVCLYTLWKNDKIKTAVFIGHIILSVIFLINVQFTIAILIYVVAMAAVILSNGNTKRLILFLIIGIILSLIFSSVVASLFGYLSEKTESDVLTRRFGELESFISGSNSGLEDLELRLEDYSISINEFFKYPLTGNLFFGKRLGGHSAVLDYLAISGIFGLSVMVFAFRSVYKKTICRFKTVKNYELIVLSQILFLVYACLNPAFDSGQFLIAFILPTAVCVMIGNKIENTEEQERIIINENSLAL